MKTTLLIGIDVGTHTGFAVWDRCAEAFTEVTSMPIHAALLRVKEIADRYSDGAVAVVFEDARLRKWYGTHTAKKDRAKLQGAGSVKRDSTIWEDALRDWGIPFSKVAPKDNITKMDAEPFRRLTGWTRRTNEHGRDAAMLVWGR